MHISPGRSWQRVETRKVEVEGGGLWRIKGVNARGIHPLNRVNSDSCNFLECRPIIFLILASFLLLPPPIHHHSSPSSISSACLEFHAEMRSISRSRRNDLYRSRSFSCDRPLDPFRDRKR